jgi:hypothetical protein
VDPVLFASIKLRSGQYGGPEKVDVAELAVDVVDILSEALPTIELKSTVEDVPGGALLDSGLVVTTEFGIAVGAVDVAATLELEIPELVLAVEINDGPEVETPVPEPKTAMLDGAVGIEEGIELDATELELETTMLELEAGPDGTIELEGTVVELSTLELDTMDEEMLATELELAMLEPTAEL